MAAKGSFAQRMASMASTVENWDDEDFDTGPSDLFTTTTSIHSMSSRVSLSGRSESNVGEDDWQVLLTPEDDASTQNAISSAKQAGIPIPKSVPSSALLGGSIKRLGKKKSTRKIDVDDDWGNDLELPANAAEGLKLKPLPPRTPADDQDEFDDWGEGSLGIRFGGTKRDTRGARSSSVSAMSPSMGSIMTLESEDDDLNGLVLPTEPLDFGARLEKLKKSEHPVPTLSPIPNLPKREPPPTSAPRLDPSPEFPNSPTADSFTSPTVDSIFTPPSEHEPQQPQEQEQESQPQQPKPKGVEEEDDFLEGLEIGLGETLDPKKLNVNRNIVVKKSSFKPTPPPAARPATTITFTDKPSSSKIPRPLSTSRSRLTPVYESGASTLGHSRPIPTTTSAQLLRAKRSAPLLRNTSYGSARGSIPFLPAGSTSSQSHHVMSKNSQGHLRRDSDPHRPLSPPTRSFSRMSSTNHQDTPSRAGIRRELAPSALARRPPPPKRLTQPQGRKKVYGDGTELELFDDLPTSATKEKQFEKTPRNVPSNKTLRQQPSNTRLPMPDRMATPLPQTPKSPTHSRMDNTPRFARDTAASRNAREQRLAGTRSRGEGPIPPTPTNWKAHVAAKSPHTSPTAHRKRGSGQKPMLIKAISAPYAKNEKGMVYNPTLQRWEGNEDALVPFSHPNTSTTTLALTTASTPTFAPPNHPFNHAHDRSHSISHTALSSIQAAQQKSISSRAVRVAPQPSPPRPALISQISAPRGVQYEGRMVYDPVSMKWQRAPRLSTDSRAMSIDLDDEEDPFAGIEDLKDNESVAGHGGGGFAGNSASNLEDPAFVGEEFDLGPSFIRRQREEEAVWRRRVEGWVGGLRDNGESKEDGWRWAIRKFAAGASAEA
ncbi:hypothetical protein BS50DRAFT_215506 [Corynespora cassiicola Philippines]|uniref:Cytokinesis regulator n=1 Tax=Corynespora cassiicola Philippines TaxID=1448308 RepID=A0A2T2N4E3_CORCC|nr:hypothetical protein BS50DRAFT_215506 [Corynespora cassiicola Philippines]